MAYVKAFNCSYDAALKNSYRLMENEGIRKEIQRLKREKKKSILISKDDIIDRYMKIAFSDMTDFAEWGVETVPVIGQFGPVQVKNEETGEKEILTQEVNKVKFKESNNVDGGLIREIKQGRDGTSIKLEDRLKALEWLANFFEMNPMDKHRKDFDKNKLQIQTEQLQHNKEIDNKKIEIEEKKLNSENSIKDTHKAIKEFLDATRPNNEELENLFDDGCDENEEDRE
jgi:phage terminase small subunit